MIHLSVVLGEQLFFKIDQEHKLFSWVWQKKRKKLFSEEKKGNGCFFLWKMWSLTGVRQNKMNVKARTHFHMLFWELWEGLNQFPHGKEAAHTQWDISVLQPRHASSQGATVIPCVPGAKHQDVSGAWSPILAGSSASVCSDRAPSWLLPHLHDPGEVPLTRSGPPLAAALSICWSIHEQDQI